MTTTAKRSTAPRLPFLLALLLAFLAAPVAVSDPAAPFVSGISAAAPAHVVDAVHHDLAPDEGGGSLVRTPALDSAAQAATRPAPDRASAPRTRSGHRAGPSRAPPAVA